MKRNNEFYIFDLGSISDTKDRIIAPSMLYRSGTLHNLSNKEIRMLEDLNIKNIIDLREGRNATLKSDKIRNMPSFTYWNF